MWIATLVDLDGVKVFIQGDHMLSVRLITQSLGEHNDIVINVNMWLVWAIEGMLCFVFMIKQKDKWKVGRCAKRARLTFKVSL